VGRIAESRLVKLVRSQLQCKNLIYIKIQLDSQPIRETGCTLILFLYFEYEYESYVNSLVPDEQGVY